ncbi:30S ribosomal protein S27e [Cucumispora dikerogammari]|nr:30S ribosomal protein S27e [Cucumispora dikerogammari]
MPATKQTTTLQTTTPQLPPQETITPQTIIPQQPTNPTLSSQQLTKLSTILNPSITEFNRVNKHKNVFPSNRGTFINIICNNCQALKICYSHSQTNISCNTCGTELVKSRGGRVEIIGGNIKY